MKSNENAEKSNTENFPHFSRSNTIEDIFTKGSLSFTAKKPVRRNPNLDKLVLTPLNFKQLTWDEVEEPTVVEIFSKDENNQNEENKNEKLTPINEAIDETDTIEADKKDKNGEITPVDKASETDNKIVSICKGEQGLLAIRRNEALKNLNQSPRIINDGKGANFFEELPDVPIIRFRKDIFQNKNRLHVVRSNQGVKNLYDGKENIITLTENKKEIAPADKGVKKDDSFDFDFSVLSLYTPVKQKAKEKVDNNFVTPKISNKKPVHQPVIQYSAKKAVEHIVKQKKDINLPQQQLSMCELKPEAGYKRLMVNGVKYIMMNCLGKGGSSEVFDCYNEEKKIHVAIKCVTLTNTQSATGYINEVKLLKMLQKCDRIIKMFDYEILESEKKLYVVLEKGGEDLTRILKQLAMKQSHIPIYMLIFYWLEMLHAVRQIHMNGIIHADLKPSNFIRAEEGLKLIDFGIATSVASDMTSVYKSTQEGTCNYISPEALNNDTSGGSSPLNSNCKYKLNFKSDVWSLGCILYQLIYRQTPFEHIKHTLAKLYAITNPQYEIPFPPAPWVPQRFLVTIKKCLQRNVKSRPSVEDLIKEYEEMLLK